MIPCMAEQDRFMTARIRRDLPRITRSLGRAPTREELAEHGFDAPLLKRLEAAGVLKSELIVIDASGARRRAYQLRRFTSSR